MVYTAGHIYVYCMIAVYYVAKLAIALPEVGPNALNTKRQTCGEHGVQGCFNPAQNCFVRCENEYG